MASLTPRQTSKDLNGHNTVVFLQSFSDRILVLVTQLGKVGSLIQATLPPTAQLLPESEEPAQEGFSLPEPSPAIQLIPLLGSAPSQHLQTLHSIYAAQIATIVWTQESKQSSDVFRHSVVIGLALAKGKGDSESVTSEEKEVFDGVMGMVYELLQ